MWDERARAMLRQGVGRRTTLPVAAAVLVSQAGLAHAQGVPPAAATGGSEARPVGTSTISNAASSQESNEAPTPVPILSFEEAVRRASRKNPTVQVAEQEVRRAEALVTEARASWVPTVTGNASFTRLDSDRVLGTRVLANANQLSANVVVVVPLVNARGWAATARASENVTWSKLSASDVKRQIAIATGRAYLTVLAQHRVLESSQHALAQARAHERYAQERFDGGIGNRLDFVRAAQARASSETRVEAQTAALTRAQEALGVLVGESGPIDAREAILPEPPSLPRALAGATSARPDIAAQRERVELTRKAVRDDYTDYLPILSAVGQPFYQNPATPTLPGTGWQAQLVLSVPFYDGGNRHGLASERAALREEAKVRLEGLLRQARSDVRASFEAMQRADAAFARAREAAALAEESLTLSEAAYRAGATTNIEVIDAERSALDATTDAAIAEDAARQARLELLAASGHFP